MTILFEKDWKDENGNWVAMPHLSSKNLSFVRMAAVLKKMGIKNYMFHLALHDPDLENVDPHDLEEDTPENAILRQKVLNESKINIWYFMREVVRIYVSGGPSVPFKLTRGSLAMLWCVSNNIHYATMQPRQTGKAQPYYSPVKTKNGWKLIGDLVVGDEIVTPGGYVSTVTEIFEQGEVDCYRVYFEDGRFTDCATDHLWEVHHPSIANEDGNWGTLSTSDVSSLMMRYRRVPVEIALIEPEQCPELETPMDPYQVGVAMASMGRTAPDEQLSAVYANGSIEQRLSLLRGLCDTGGTPNSDGSIVVKIHDRGMREYVQYVVRSLGGIATIDKRNVSKLTIRLREPQQCFSDLTKQQVFDQAYYDLRLKIKEIRWIGKRKCRCIKLDDPAGLYVTNDFIVTHNTVAALAIFTWILYSSGHNATVGMMAKDNKLREENVSRIRRLADSLPSWWLSKDKFRDKNNATGIRYQALGTELTTMVAQDSVVEADKQGRGSTLPAIWWDEFEFISQIETSYSTMIASGGTARITAAENGMIHSNIITTTAGDPTHEACKQAAAILDGALEFSEGLYDIKDNETLMTVVEKSSSQNMIIGIFSHLQLGRDNDWLRKEIRIAKMSPDKVMREYLNQRVSLQEHPIIPKEDLVRIAASKREVAWIEFLGDSFVGRWYVTQAEAESAAFRARPLIVGCDSSELIGQDATTLVAVDPNTLEVVFTMYCKEGNIHKVGTIVHRLLMRYPKMVFVPENKSSGTAIIDSVCLLLKNEGVNPFTRIFNWIADRRDELEFAKYNIHDPRLADTVAKKYFGIKTSKSSRDELYSEVLMMAASKGGDGVRDARLIRELSALTERNGRVDHVSGGNDDHVIAWALAMWFIMKAKNHALYGIPDRYVMRGLTTSVDDSKARERQAVVIAASARLEDVESQLKRCSLPAVRRVLESQIVSLRKLIGNDGAPEIAVASDLFRDPSKYVDRAAVNEYRPVGNAADLADRISSLFV